MFKLKKTAVAVLAFGSSAVFAGTMGPVCSAVNVTVPCERVGWDVGIYALYLQPSYNNNISYIGTTATAAPGTSTYIDNDPDWGWGFKLEGSYHFGTGNDLNLNWYHLDDNSATRSIAGTFAFFDITDLATERFTVAPKWDAVNLEFGQHVDFGEFKNIRFHGGVQYARIETGLSWYAAGAVATDFVSAASTSKFNGFGPRLGADMSYDLGNGFAIYGNGATAILAGTSKVNSQVASTGVSTFYVNASRTALVPELEAKLGLKYTFALGAGDLTLDGGYMWQNYFHAQQNLVFVGTPGESDFGLQGPYFGLKWMGALV